MSKKQKEYTTADLKKAIESMEKEGLDLDAPIELSVEGDGDHYSIESIGHFHVIPNMTIHLKLKGYVKKNADKAFTLSQFLDLYNFREMVENKEDTQIIRIYTEFPSKYIEFGVNEWSYGETKTEIIESVMNKKVLERIVRSFNYDTDRNIFCVFLEEIE